MVEGEENALPSAGDVERAERSPAPNEREAPAIGMPLQAGRWVDGRSSGAVECLGREDRRLRRAREDRGGGQTGAERRRPQKSV
jgi:hypothetical protein